MTLTLCHHYSFVEYNKKKAVKWLKKVAKSGNVSYQYNLGLTLSESRDQKDQTEGLYWLIKAANSGLIVSQQVLARIYEEGKIVEKNYCNGRRWREILAYRGDVHSMLKIADYYCKGLCYKKDNIMALSWINVAELNIYNDAFKERVIKQKEELISKSSLSKNDINRAEKISKTLQEPISKLRSTVEREENHN